MAVQIAFRRDQGSMDKSYVVSLPNGSYVVAWRDLYESKIKFRIFYADGTAKSAITEIASTVGAPNHFDVTVLDNGSFAVALSGANNAITQQIVDINGVLVGQSLSVTGTEAGRTKDFPALAASETGVVAVWSDTGLIQVKHGEQTASYRIDGNAINPDVARLVKTDPNATERHVLTWSEGIGGPIRVLITTNGGTTQVSAPQSPGSGHDPSIIGTTDGGFVVVFRTDAGGVWVRKYDQNGNAVPENYEIVGGRAFQPPHIVALSKGGFNGGFAVVYNQDIYNNQGNPTGDKQLFIKLVKWDGTSVGPVAIHPPGAIDATISAVTELADGRISIAWDNPSDGATGIYHRIIDAREIAVTVNGTEGADYYIGTSLDPQSPVDKEDELNGNGGDDCLEGGSGGDVIDGGEGTDTAEFRFAKSGVKASLVHDIGGTVGDAEGDRYVRIENFYGSRFNDTLDGGDGTNRLTGWTGNDVLDGKGGNDILDGGAGNDTYYVDAAGDLVIDARGGGTDTLYSSATYTVSATAEIEVMRAAGTASIALTGNGFSNKIYGNSGANTLKGEAGNDTVDGGTGADKLYGGTGNDIYYVDNARDLVVESARGGTDYVYASVSYALSSSYEIERLYAKAGTASINLTGNSFANAIYGNSGANKINGGLGADVLTGGAGRDGFVFTTRPSSSNVDRVVDFKSADDTFYLDNAVFTALGRGTTTGVRFSSDMFVANTRAQDREDRIVYDKGTGNLYYDADGTGRVAQVKIATLTNKTPLSYTDFYVI